MGASKGWSNPHFIVPFALSFPIAAVFFWWEWKIDQRGAVLPVALWKVKNMGLMCFVGLYLFAGIAVSLGFYR